MTRTGRAHSLYWFLIAIAIAAILISTAVRFSRSNASPPTPPASVARAAGRENKGVVCFGIVDLEHGIASLAPLQPGRVAEVLVAENQKVAQGTDLLRLEDGVARARLTEAEASLMLAQLHLRAARKQHELHHDRVARQQAMRDAMSSRVAAARRVRAHEEKLAKSAVITESDRFISDEKIREMEALERVEAQRLAELEAQDVEADIHRAEYALTAAEARREQAKIALEECHVRAPRAGTVLRIQAAPGDLLGGQPGQPAVLFAADGPQVIRATIEQEFASRVKEGELALVSDEDDPTTTWRGRVDRLAGWYSQRRMVLHDPSQLSDVRTLECVIVLEPGQPRLRLGQSVRISIGSVPP